MHAASPLVRCWKCDDETPTALACRRCGVVQPLADDADLFAVLGVPRRLDIDTQSLEKRYHEASRLSHPDRFATAGERAQALSVAASAAVNRAYRTLRDPVLRGRYWLELHGRPLGDDNKTLPADLAELVFEAQEKIAELRTSDVGANRGKLRTEVQTLLGDVAGRIKTLRRQLGDSYRGWARSGEAEVLSELKRRLSELAYLNTLERDLDGALEG